MTPAYRRLKAELRSNNINLPYLADDEGGEEMVTQMDLLRLGARRRYRIRKGSVAWYAKRITDALADPLSIVLALGGFLFMIYAVWG